MRLPWVQVTQEAFGLSRSLAGILGCDRHRALSLLLDLWSWGLDQGPEDQPPSGVVESPRAARMLAGAVEWAGSPDELAEALEDLGVIEVLQHGIRVRGMRRYHSTWKKNRKSAGGVPGGTRPEPGGVPNGRGDAERVPGVFRTGSEQKPKRQTQTQKRSSDDDLPAGAADDVDQVEAFVLATPEPAGPTPEDLRRIWNQHRAPEQPEWRETSAKRAAAARARLADRPLYGSPDSWEAVVQRISRSSFARGLVAGRDGRTWIANPEWLLRPDSAARTLEGQYDDRAAPKPPEPPKPTVAPFDYDAPGAPARPRWLREKLAAEAAAKEAANAPA